MSVESAAFRDNTIVIGPIHNEEILLFNSQVVGIPAGTWVFSIHLYMRCEVEGGGLIKALLDQLGNQMILRDCNKALGRHVRAYKFYFRGRELRELSAEQKRLITSVEQVVKKNGFHVESIEPRPYGAKVEDLLGSSWSSEELEEIWMMGLEPLECG